MQNGFVAPLRLIIKIRVLRKAARVHHAEMRTDARPFVRGRLAAIVEASPDKCTCSERTRSKEIPPLLGGGSVTPRRIHIVCGHEAVRWIVRVNSARADRAGFFAADDWLARKIGMEF